MGYINSAPYFCIVVETLSDLSNEVIDQRDVASAHPMEQAAEARAVDDAGALESQADSYGDNSWKSSAQPPQKILISTWTTSFLLSRDTPRRGANCSGTSSIKLTGCSAPIIRRIQTGKNPSPLRNWGKEMGHVPPRRQSWGGTLTP